MERLRKNRGNRKTRAVFLLISFLIFLHSGGLAYIMPSEQLLEFMTKNFSRINTLVIIQSAQQETSLLGEEVQKRFKEQLWLKSPDSFHLRVLDEEWISSAVRDLSYRRLLMASGLTDTEAYLQGIGIDLGDVSLTRIDGEVAYHIGSQDPGSPRILISKNRFLPLLISYPSGENPGTMVKVRFKDFRQLEKGWYPFEIIYTLGDERRETYTIQSYDVNVPIK